MPSPLLPGTSIAVPKRASSGRGISRLTIEVQGLNAVAEHFFTIAALTEQLAPGIVDFYGDVVAHNARQFVRKKTWATHDSITKEGVFISGFAIKSYDAEIYASTIQARFLEWGTVNNPAYPFMIPAIDMVEKDFFKAFIDVAKIPDQLAPRVKLSGAVGKDPRIRSPITQLRSGLYSLSKFLGDIAVFGAGLPGLRAFTIGAARALGDMNSIMSGAVGARFSRRLRGRAVGRLAGFGTASLSASKSYSGSFTGGQRIYNRTVGRMSAPIVSTNFPSL